MSQKRLYPQAVRVRVRRRTLNDVPYRQSITTANSHGYCWWCCTPALYWQHTSVCRRRVGV